MSLVPPSLNPNHQVDQNGPWTPCISTEARRSDAQDLTGRNQAFVDVRGDGSTTSRVTGVQQTSIAEIAASVPAPWISARSQGGTPQMPHEVTGDSIMKFPGFAPEVTLDQAYQLGLLPRPKVGGSLPQPAPQATTTVAKPTEELHPDLQDEPISREVEARVAELGASIGAGTQLQAVAELAEQGEISATTLASAASQMGIEPSQVQSAVDGLRPHFERQADEAAGKFGVDPQAVWEWAWEAKPREMQNAIHRHLTLRNTHAYQELAKEYVRSLDKIAPQMILNAQLDPGVTVARDARGEVVFTLADGRKLSWSEAVSSGGLNLSQVR